MKKFITLALTAVLAVGALSAKTIKEVRLTTEPPMHCESCENKIKKALKFEKGVKDVVTSVENQCVTIVFDADKTNEDKLAKALKKGGYDTTVITECDEKIEEKHCTSDAKQEGDCCSKKQ